MNYLENAIKFLVKYWILALPLLILTALAFLLTGPDTINAGSLLNSYANTGLLRGMPTSSWFYTAIASLMPSGGGFWLLLLNFAAIPLTYGLVNKNLETGYASLGDVGQTLSRNLVKYILYFAGTLILGLAVFIACAIVILLLGLIMNLLGVFGNAIMVLVMLAIAIGGIVAVVLLSMWFSAMVVDGLDVVAAAKKSIEIVRTVFWTVLGITILVAIICGIVGFILSFLKVIPLLGPIIASVVPTAQTFVMIVFLLTLYREKTGKVNAI